MMSKKFWIRYTAAFLAAADQNGRIYAVRPGRAVITARADEQKKGQSS